MPSVLFSRRLLLKKGYISTEEAGAGESESVSARTCGCLVLARVVPAPAKEECVTTPVCAQTVSHNGVRSNVGFVLTLRRIQNPK